MSPLKGTIALLVLLSVTLAACGTARDPVLYDPDTGHAGGWITDHPAAYAARPEQCHDCHGDDLAGGNSAVSCVAFSLDGQACHAGGPSSAGHGTGWILGHPSAYRANPGSCAACHGGDLRGGSSGVGCYQTSWNGMTCHAGGPGTGGHPSGWVSSHPAAYRASPGSCATCHGTDLGGGSSGVSCSATSWNGIACHGGGPGTGGGHPPGWVISAHVAAAQANVTSCGSCHGADLRGGTSGIACTRCHMESWQKVHPLNWYPNVQNAHKDYVKSRGTSACANVWCHGSALRGVPGSGPSCIACHGEED